MVMRALLLALAILVVAPVHAQDVKGVTLDKPSPVGDFELIDHRGEPFTREDLMDRWSLVFLGFTHCPDVCPFTLANLEAVRSELSLLLPPERLPQIVFLAVDPDRDRPVLADYVAHFDLSFVGVTGEPGEIARFAHGLDAYYRLEKKSDDDDSYDVVHSAAVAVIDPDGAVKAKITPPFHPHDTANYLHLLLRGVEGTN
ncbi:SCO family protein [Chelativorans xinjiangense]|uniref:SCO family protein n=1 Tax=Chelativorans xinjiangense TaxID=2681485 RepID=UPI001FE927AD|nr:SCO family protein [Chelativorans xinjiangense]